MLLNDTALFDLLFDEAHVMDFIGALEYEPEVRAEQRPKHREFLRDHVGAGRDAAAVGCGSCGAAARQPNGSCGAVVAGGFLSAVAAWVWDRACAPLHEVATPFSLRLRSPQSSALFMLRRVDGPASPSIAGAGTDPRHLRSHFDSLAPPFTLRVPPCAAVYCRVLQAMFKEVVPIAFPDVRSKIHQTYRQESAARRGRSVLSEAWPPWLCCSLDACQKA